MLGTSRDSLAAVQQVAAAQPVTAATASELLAAVGVLSADRALLVALVDSGVAADSRKALLSDVFGSKVSAVTLTVLNAAIERRWAEPVDLVEGLEAVAASVLFGLANAAGELDRVEEELFHFGRAVDANPELQMALTNPALSGEAKSAVVGDLLSASGHASTTALLRHLSANLRGRRVDAALSLLNDIAASARNRQVAEVRVARALAGDQAQRLAAVLSRLTGKDVSLNVIVDPNVLGGVSVRIAGEEIDGTVRNKLEQDRDRKSVV